MLQGREQLDTAPLVVRLNPKRLLRVLSVCVALVILCHIASLVLSYRTGVSATPVGRALINMFNMEREGNVPTAFSGLALALAALLAGLTAVCASKRKAPFVRHWWGLSAIMLYLAIDELAAIHDQLNEPMGATFGGEGAPGWMKWAWVVPALAVVLVVGFTYLRFLRALPRRWALLFIASGVIYVGGALGLEMLAAQLWTDHGFGIYVRVIATVEESLEMIGILVFTYAVADYLAAHYLPVDIAAVGRPETAEVNEASDRTEAAADAPADQPLAVGSQRADAM